MENSTQSSEAGIGELAKALAKAQSQMSAVAYDSDNPHFKSRYASLAAICDAVRKPLADNGLSYVQLPSSEGLDVYLTTRLIHSSGEWIESTFGASVANERNKGVQGLGSILTYLRRYGLSAICGVAADEDTDGGKPETGNEPEALAPLKPRATKKEKEALKARHAAAMATISAHYDEETAKDCLDQFKKAHGSDWNAICEALEFQAKGLDMEADQ